MEEKRETIIATPDVEGSILFGLYLKLNEDKDVKLDSFMQFLKVDSPERTSFLDEHCDWEIMEQKDFDVLKYTLK